MLPSSYMLDACSLLNLVASRRFEDIAASLPVRFATPEQAVSEVRYVRRGGGGADAKNLEAIDLAALQTAGVLTVCRLETSAELTTFVDLALEIDDGEAAACALGQRRSHRPFAAPLSQSWERGRG